MNLPPLRDIIAQHDLRAEKSLGQNFLLDLNLTAKIARGAGDLAGKTVIEIGPGPGGLTRALLDSDAAQVIAVEFDPRAVAALASLRDAYPDRLTILQADALKIDCATLGDAPRAIVANLPYNIATPLLIGWLKRIDAFDSLTLMFQREVAERIVARPGSKAYGRLAVMTGWLCDAKILFDISPQAFTPPPKVTSSVVHLSPLPKIIPRPAGEAVSLSRSGLRETGEGLPPAGPSPDPLMPDGISGSTSAAGRGDISFATMEKVVAAAFGQRRKMLRAALKTLGVDTEVLLEMAGIEPTDRAETLDISRFIGLAHAFDALQNRSGA
jgi:16S rRNA (adenine1518-N6/adenine1519-N6)-dimethyltransferase